MNEGSKGARREVAAVVGGLAAALGRGGSRELSRLPRVDFGGSRRSTTEGAALRCAAVLSPKAHAQCLRRFGVKRGAAMVSEGRLGG